MRSRVFFPVHFDGRLRVGGELAVAPDDVDVSLFRGGVIKVMNGGRRCGSQLTQPGLPRLGRTPVKAGKAAKNPAEPASLPTLHGPREKRVLTFFTLFS